MSSLPKRNPTVSRHSKGFSEILELKPMGAYGAVPEDPEDFAASTVANQQRLLKNNYVPLTEEEIETIYKNRM